MSVWHLVLIQYPFYTNVDLYHSLKIIFKSKSYHTVVIHIPQQRLHHYIPICMGMKPGKLGVQCSTIDPNMGKIVIESTENRKHKTLEQKNYNSMWYS